MSATPSESRKRFLTLAGLVLLAFVPRCYMAIKIGGLCPDAVQYIRIAQSYGQGSILEDKHNRFALNLYPAILTALHRAGLDWELAGKLWGVIMGAITVLPIYGLARRQFDEPTAWSAAAIYAVHAELVRWSPEGVRDPTFWFLWMLALYCLWLAIERSSVAIYLAAGFAMALAALTRSEGLFLLIPFGFWTICRARGESRTSSNRSAGRKLAIGALLALAILPLLLFLASKLWFPRHAPWELVRTKPLELIEHWWHGRAAPSSGNLLSPQAARWRTLSLMGTYLTAAMKGATPGFALLLLVGFGRGRRAFFRFELCPLWLTSAAFLAAIWIHLFVADETSKRYFLPIVLMTTPLAAIGLQSLAVVIKPWAARWMKVSKARRVARWAPLGLFALASLGDVVHSDYSQRAVHRIVGHAIAEHCTITRTSGPRILGPPGVTSIVAWYAQGEQRLFAEGLAESTIESLACDKSIDAMLLPTENDGSMASSTNDWTRRAGFEQIDNAQLAGGLRRIAVFVRSSGAEPSR